MVFYRVLQLAVAHAPVRYRDLVANPQGTPCVDRLADHHDRRLASP